MGKSAISYRSLSTSNTSANNPFWIKPKTKKSTSKDIAKIVWKWFKMGIFLFMMLMGLWGCFQSMFDSSIATNPTLGQGLEFAFPPGKGYNDYRFVASGGINGQYNTMYDFTMAYGPFYAFFVWPACQLVINLMWVTKDWWGGMNTLLAIFVLLLIIRMLSLLVTLKSSFQNEKMSEVQGKIAEINAKYKNATDMASKQAKQQEIQAIYAKHQIKPFAAFEQMFITLPIFLIVYRVVTILRPMKASILFGIWNFAATPTSEIFGNFTSGGWTYIFFLLLVVPAQAMSMIVPQKLAKKRNRGASAQSKQGDKQMRKFKITQIVFIVVMSLVVCFSATGVGVYWFLNSFFSVGQTLVIHHIIMKRREKGKDLDSTINSFVFS